MKEKTLTIIKPDAMEKKCFGAIIQRLLDEGFEFLHLKHLHLTKEQAEGFYAVHKDKFFFSELVEFMTSGPVIVIALQRDNAVNYLREIMGATDPKKADSSTIRAKYGTDIQRNAIHGSDSIENAKKELGYFFAEYQIAGHNNG
ncbi:MAG: nucleoside-diphosphate kinase [Acidobacteria bacterium]|nr:nucleoside-diphosphate kinase [Acidobacteriota bacterium]